MAEAEHNHFDASHLFQHIQDAEYFDVPRAVSHTGKVHIPQPFKIEQPSAKIGVFQPVNFAITKFMVLELVAAVLMAAIFIRVAQLISSNRPPRGRFWNMFEFMLVYIRDDVARPAIGKHDADRFLPFLWTMFFFVLICNLLGLVPWAGSATAAFGTTAALALITFGTVVGAGMAKLGPVHFWLAQVPHMDVPPALGIFLKPMIFVLELVGLLIRHFVLAVRLLANIMAGHLVLVVIITFIAASYSSLAWWGVAPASIVGATLLSLLELLVAFIQAYIFTFLSALFIGMAVHPH
ncbi:MAG TPA: F0F1 ATP synthase subunit A [Pirellulales bacterium]